MAKSDFWTTEVVTEAAAVKRLSSLSGGLGGVFFVEHLVVVARARNGTRAYFDVFVSSSNGRRAYFDVFVSSINGTRAYLAISTSK